MQVKLLPIGIGLVLVLACAIQLAAAVLMHH
jgi:hypothetical protein